MNNNNIIGTISINSSGNGYLTNNDDDIFIHKSNLGKSLHNDVVKITTTNAEHTEGKVIEIITRDRTEFVGILQMSKKFGFVIPDSKKMKKDIFIKKEDCEGYSDGEKVLCTISDWFENAKNPNGKIIKSLGYPLENNTEINSIVYEYGFDTSFNDDIESEEIINDDIDRTDFRDLLTFTIDGEDAKDLDDAISVNYIGDNLEIGIHIADVSHYIKKGSLIDLEAFNRGTSLYLVDRVIPMLPEKISNGLCSLTKGDKLTFSFIFLLDENGEVIKERFVKGIINSNYRLTYNNVQSILDGQSSGVDDELISSLMDINTYAKKIRNRRLSNSLSFNRTEVKFVLDDLGVPTEIIKVKQMDSHKLIEEFMVMTNKKVCEFIIKNKKTAIHRSHDSPNIEKLSELNSLIKPIGLGEIDCLNPKEDLNKLLTSVSNTPYENMISTLTIRSQSKALYDINNIGHWGMGLEFYSHTTSPIRRYSDLIIHRILNSIINNSKPEYTDLELSEICEHINKKELNANRAQRESIKYKQTQFLLDKIGYIFKGVIVSVNKWGVYVELENKCEGMLSSNILLDNGFYIDMDKLCIYNDSISIRIGDEVDVEIIDVSLINKEVDLDIKI